MSLFRRIKDKQVTQYIKYTQDLIPESSWIAELTYNHNNGDLVVETVEEHFYLYEHVSSAEWEELVRRDEEDESVGSFVDSVIKLHGPGKRLDTPGGDTWQFSYVARDYSNYVEPDVSGGGPEESNLPLAVRTEVQFTLDGEVKFMKSALSVEEAVKQYLTAVEALGLDATLEAVHVYFTDE
jgi:hypothetical protein